MSDNRNCINCGAVIEYDGTAKCPYCGTSYFDFTNINLESRTPVCLRIKYNDVVFETLAIPTLFDVRAESHEFYRACGEHDKRLLSMNTRGSVTTEIAFESIYNEHGILYTITENKGSD